jgi:hypothetical protein
MAPTIATHETFTPTISTRLSARLRRRTLDQELSRGADPCGTPVRALRATELTGTQVRQRTAEQLEQLATFHDQPHVARFGPRRAAAEVNQDRLARLAQRLRDDRPVAARGMASLSLALSDGTGPVYNDRDGRALAEELERVDAALAA